MLAEYKRKTNIGVGLGIVVQIVGRVLSNVESVGVSLVGLLLVIAGAVSFIWGCTQYAKGKGHSAWFGVLGILSILGLLVLVFLPDKHKEGHV